MPAPRKEETFIRSSTPTSGRTAIILDDVPMKQFIRKKKFVFKPITKKSHVNPKTLSNVKTSNKHSVKPIKASEMPEATLKEVIDKKNATIIEIGIMVQEILDMEVKQNKAPKVEPAATPTEPTGSNTLSTPKKRKLEHTVTTTPDTENATIIEIGVMIQKIIDMEVKLNKGPKVEPAATPTKPTGTNTLSTHTTRDQRTDSIIQTVDKSTQVDQEDINYITPVIDFSTQTFNQDYHCSAAAIFRHNNTGSLTPIQDEPAEYHNNLSIIRKHDGSLNTIIPSSSVIWKHVG